MDNYITWIGAAIMILGVIGIGRSLLEDWLRRDDVDEWRIGDDD